MKTIIVTIDNIKYFIKFRGTPGKWQITVHEGETELPMFGRSYKREVTATEVLDWTVKKINARTLSSTKIYI